MTVLFKRSEMKASLAKAEKVSRLDMMTDEQKAAERQKIIDWGVAQFFKGLEEKKAEAQKVIADFASKIVTGDVEYQFRWSASSFEAVGMLDAIGFIQERTRNEKTEASVRKALAALSERNLIGRTRLSYSTCPTHNLVEDAKLAAANSIINDTRFLF